MAFNKDNYNIIFEAYKSNAIEILQQEYDAGRLTGAEFANALVQILGNVVIEASKAEQAQEQLEANTKLALNKQIKENELIDAKIKLTLKQIDEIDNKLKLAYMTAEKDIELKTHEISKVDSDIQIGIAKLALEKEKIEGDIAYQQVLTQVENEKLLLAEEELAYKKLIDPKLIELKDAEIALENAKVNETQAMIDDIQAKIKDLTNQKYLDMFGKQMDAWSLMFTSGLLEDKPTIITDDRVTEIYNYLADYTTT